MSDMHNDEGAAADESHYEIAIWDIFICLEHFTER